MRLPEIYAKELFKFLKKIGFKKIRQKGSHVFFKHKDGRTTLIPDHPAEKLSRSLLNKIIKKDIGITREEFLRKY